MSTKVFISYARADEQIAHDILQTLDEIGIECFMDTRDIKAGDDYRKKIDDALTECSAIVVVISALSSEWVMFEIGQARAQHKEILPYLSGPDVKIPDPIAPLQGMTSLDQLREYFDPVAAPRPTPEEAWFKQYVNDIPASEWHLMKVPGADHLYSSFKPEAGKKCFYRLMIPTTPGWIPRKISSGQTVDQETENLIYLVRDPIRAFEIQIGQTRALRPGGDPGTILLQGDLSIDTFKLLYPAMADDAHIWMRMVLAEISPNSQVLKHMHEVDPDETVRKLTTRNPFAPDELKKEGCLFCNDKFLTPRHVYKYKSARIICNDYPFGPFFHYIVMPMDPVHSWDAIETSHLTDMNILIKQYLKAEKNENRLNNSAGVRIGFNSSIRHLVMGKATRTSAGASIAHVHKQVWGMAHGSVNIGDHLNNICLAYSKKGIDYLGMYLDALREAGLMLWEDKNVALYVPFGQISIHELQVMVKNRNVGDYLQLEDEEIRSLSRAEFMVTRVFSKIGINSFNEIMITMPFERENMEGFRPIFTYITREIDFAVSELSLIYVVDKHPYDTLRKVKKHFPNIDKGVVS